ncbi:hypothetical protein F2P81_005275 [Scophthalmus maximus]|uniref:RGS domain-containing protein n=1 Tax=Scophthalmus maximus TaxID=52904 RepID=A0A6A4T6U4_SCOMX|nr:hypothetical protein F2P81_005275 [Scophthalmus maximus]
MDFWLACEDYKKTASPGLETRAKQIYQQYVEADAANEVNLDAATREETRQNVESARPSCFDEAQRTIYTLMEKDSYRRFLNSKLFQDLARSKEMKNSLIQAFESVQTQTLGPERSFSLGANLLIAQCSLLPAASGGGSSSSLLDDLAL